MITAWLDRLKGGERDAAGPLWRCYFPRLVALARARLRGLPRRAADEEDVALSAFDSFCRAAEAGRFPDLEDRADLWRVLLMITARKAADLAQREGRAKRDWRRTVELVDREAEGAEEFAALLQSPEPDPRFAAEVAEQYRELLDRLGNDRLGDELRQVAVWKMEGYTNGEIAARLGCALVTVERRLQVIRAVWSPQAGDQSQVVSDQAAAPLSTDH
jgi:DNA-directed RNA polymerase specialized sigma24 family protein